MTNIRPGPSGPDLATTVLTEMATASEADGFVPITSAHIDSCLFHGQAGLDFAERLLAEGARVVVPTTLNVASLDLLHPKLYRGDAETARHARRLMDVYVAMGCQPTWTCAPYQLPQRPGFGEQIAWAESNAIVFANSVLGARTNRYGDFLDISCAVAGLAPNYGLHTDAGRLATVVVNLASTDHELDSDWLYPILGSLVGRLFSTGIPAIVGLDSRASEDRLKSLGAGAASTGAIAMFHAIGVTPEAPDIAAAAGTRDLPEVTVGIDDLWAERERLSSAHSGQAPQAVSLGAPHYSRDELIRVGGWLKDRKAIMPLYINTHRGALESVPDVIETLTASGATVVTDTCTYITPIIDPSIRVVMTDSAKWAYYAPGNLGVDVVFGSPRECVETALGQGIEPR